LTVPFCIDNQEARNNVKSFSAMSARGFHRNRINIFMAALLSPFKRFKKEPGEMLHGLQNQKKGVMLVTSPL
jgi:hypothetical protein